MIYIASMNMRGKWAPTPHADCLRVNVTSAQSKESRYRHAFSPMTPLESGYKGYACFENYWQAGKRYEGQTDEDVVKMLMWWKRQDKGRRRYAGGKGKRVTHAEFGGKNYDYVESRKEIYVPEYAALVKQHVASLFMDVQKDVVVYDFDGPRSEDRSPVCEQVCLELLRSKIEDTSVPFGHGYVVAGLIAGIEPWMYT